METLFIQLSLNGYWFLNDSKGNHIGWFDTHTEAENWCKENGYRFVVHKER